MRAKLAAQTTVSWQCSTDVLARKNQLQVVKRRHKENETFSVVATESNLPYGPKLRHCNCHIEDWIWNIMADYGKNRRRCGRCEQAIEQATGGKMAAPYKEWKWVNGLQEISWRRGQLGQDSSFITPRRTRRQVSFGCQFFMHQRGPTTARTWRTGRVFRVQRNIVPKVNGGHGASVTTTRRWCGWRGSRRSTFTVITRWF